MRKWIVRLGTLFVFNVVVLFIIGAAMDRVDLHFLAVLGAGLVLTLATVWIRPALSRMARSTASKQTAGSSRMVQWLVSALAVFLVAFAVWVLTVWLSDINVEGWLWGYLVPPLALLVAWFIYDLIADRLEARAAKVYDSADRKLSGD